MIPGLLVLLLLCGLALLVLLLRVLLANWGDLPMLSTKTIRMTLLVWALVGAAFLCALLLLHLWRRFSR
jgi:hypothetical protein